MRVLLQKGLLTSLFIFISGLSFSQCKEAVKSNLAKLHPYQFDGQAEYKIEEGKSVELVSTFSAGGQYRILFCLPDKGNASVFNIYEKKKRKLVFTNQIDKDYQYWDLKAKATQDYIIEIAIPPAPAGTPNRKTCVAILIGAK